jgi:hypothetical protein
MAGRSGGDIHCQNILQFAMLDLQLATVWPEAGLPPDNISSQSEVHFAALMHPTPTSP